MLCPETDAEADKRGIALAANLQQRAHGWWMVMWSWEKRQLIGIYQGFWGPGGLRVEAAEPGVLWRRMLPYIPPEVQAQEVPLIRVRAIRPAGRG